MGDTLWCQLPERDRSVYLKRYWQTHPDKYTKMRIYNRKKTKNASIFLQSQICICCGESKKMAYDHVVPLNGIGRKKTNASINLTAYKLEPLRFQFLCMICNSAKHNGVYCRKHGKYLGVWNKLPYLRDLEAE